MGTSEQLVEHDEFSLEDGFDMNTQRSPVVENVFESQVDSRSVDYSYQLLFVVPIYFS